MVEWTGISCWHTDSSIPPHYDRYFHQERERERKGDRDEDEEGVARIEIIDFCCIAIDHTSSSGTIQLWCI